MAETSQISFKKPLKVRNELSEQRRNALKEYYKLKQNEQQQQQEKQGTQQGESSESDDEVLTKEILEDKPIEEIDLKDAEFKEILQKTNKLTTSINLINSSIKDIIYNNYYELIKLNDYLQEFNDLDVSIYKEKDNVNDDSVLDLLNYKKDKSTNSLKDNSNEDGFIRLNNLMDKIVEFDEIDFNKKIKTHDQSISNLINSLTTSLENNSNQETKSILNQLVAKVKEANGQQTLILQLENLLNQIPST